MSEDARGRVRRRLAAILVAGYSRLFPGDEKEHFAELRAFLTGVIEPQIAEFGGNIFKETAELVLVEFDSAGKVTVAAPSQPNPFADASEISVSGADCGRISLAAGSARHGEDVRRIRGRDGKVAEVWLGGMRFLAEADAVAELEQRYGG
jgi:hypothetical protein